MNRFYLIFGLFIIFTCCKQEQQTDSIVSKWIDKQIIFPTNVTFYMSGSDTKAEVDLNKKFKLLTYINAEGCVACKLKMHLWTDLIEKFSKSSQDSIAFIFVLNSNNYKEINYIFENANFNYPVIYDTKDEFNRLNQFPKQLEYQTFLLDHTNKVKVIGNPIFNLAVKDLYLKYILGGTISKQSITTLTVEQTEYNLGSVPTETTKQQTVTVRNSGSTVFKLKGFTTSCDCTEATCDWQELQPGESGTFIVSYQAEEPGDFYRTVEIYGNIPDNALQFSFIGTVKKTE